MSTGPPDDKLTNLKREIRSILLSNQEGLTVRSLLKEYRETVGQNIPYLRYGFNTPLDFFQSLTDTVQISKRGWAEELILPVVSEDSSHINKLVVCQNTGKKGPRRPRPLQIPTRETKPVSPAAAPAVVRSVVPRQSRPPPGFAPLPRGAAPVCWESSDGPPGLIVFPQGGPPPPPQPVYQPPAFNNPFFYPFQNNPIYGQPNNLLFPHGPNRFSPHQQQIHNYFPGHYHPGFGSPYMGAALHKVTFVDNLCQMAQPSAQPFSLATNNRPPLERNESNKPPSREETAAQQVKTELVPYLSSEDEESPKCPQSEANSKEKLNYDINDLKCEKMSNDGLQTCEVSEETRQDVTSGPSTLDGKKGEEEDDTYVSVSSSSTEHSRNHFEISDKMRDNFKEILKEHPQGILSSKFAKAYKDKYNVPLNFSDLGYRAVSELATANPKIFSVHRSKTDKGSTDWIFFDADCKAMKEDSYKYIPRQLLEHMELLARRYPNGLRVDDVPAAYQKTFHVRLDVKTLGFESISSFLMNCTSICYSNSEDKGVVYPLEWGKPEVLTEEDLTTDHPDCLLKVRFPEYVCAPSIKYKQIDISSLTDPDVVVADTLSPEIMYLQDIASFEALAEMMSDIDDFYCSNDCGGCRLNRKICGNGGLPCAAIFSNKWHRALVVLPDETDVKILYVDYGTTATVKYEETRLLHERFTELPAQAIRAKLYGIRPVSPNGWTNLDHFYKSCLNKPFSVKIVKKHPKIPSIDVILTYSNCEMEGEQILNKRMVLDGLAVFDEKGLKYFGIVMPPTKPEARTDCPRTSSPAQSHSSHCDLSSTRLDLTSTPSGIMQVLPFLMTVNNDWEEVMFHLKQALKGLDGCGGDNSRRTPLTPPSCCDKHLFFHLFQYNSEVFSEAWKKVLNSKYNTLRNDLMKEISSLLNIPLHVSGDKKLCSTLNIQSEEFVPRGLSNGYLPCDPDSRSLPSLSKESSPNNSHLYNEIRPGSGMSQRTECSEMSLPFDGVRIACTSVVDIFFNFLLFNNDVYLLRDELLRKLGPPGAVEMFKMKSHNLNLRDVKFKSIGPSRNHFIYEFLLSKKMVGANERVAAIPLSSVGHFLGSVFPPSDYASEFDKLSAQYKHDDPFWQECSF